MSASELFSTTQQTYCRSQAVVPRPGAQAEMPSYEPARAARPSTRGRLRCATLRRTTAPQRYSACHAVRTREYARRFKQHED
eukprot:5326843-Pleurochrysis_carterae.AAC.5